MPQQKCTAQAAIAVPARYIISDSEVPTNTLMKQFRIYLHQFRGLQMPPNRHNDGGTHQDSGGTHHNSGGYLSI